MMQFFDLPLLTIFVVSAVGTAACIEAGRLLGARAKRKGGDEVVTLEAAILGLLALIMSFTVAISISRHDLRREALLEESNAIGTAALRATLLPAPHDANALDLLRRYTETRRELNRSLGDGAALTAVIDRSNAILTELWKSARTLAAGNEAMVPTGLYIQSLNDLIDDQENRVAALLAGVPRIVLVALYGIAAVAIAFVGYGLGVEDRRRRLPAYTLGFLVAAVILLIQDLDRPNEGFIVVNQRPLADAADALRGLGR